MSLVELRYVLNYLAILALMQNQRDLSFQVSNSKIEQCSIRTFSKRKIQWNFTKGQNMRIWLTCQLYDWLRWYLVWKAEISSRFSIKFSPYAEFYCSYSGKSFNLSACFKSFVRNHEKSVSIMHHLVWLISNESFKSESKKSIQKCLHGQRLTNYWPISKRDKPV